MSPAELNHILNALSNKDIPHTHPRQTVDTHHPGAYYPPVRTICVFWYNYWYLRTIHRCVLYPEKYGSNFFTMSSTLVFAEIFLSHSTMQNRKYFTPSQNIHKLGLNLK